MNRHNLNFNVFIRLSFPYHILNVLLQSFKFLKASSKSLICKLFFSKYQRYKVSLSPFRIMHFRPSNWCSIQKISDEKRDQKLSWKLVFSVTWFDPEITLSGTFICRWKICINYSICDNKKSIEFYHILPSQLINLAKYTVGWHKESSWCVYVVARRRKYYYDEKKNTSEIPISGKQFI